ncbi:MAG: hypothetical protein HUJ30_08235 [Gammaproteobacteria bacterium]|nr:hypothetical protein [Gammaproteobacteria bacterium]
MEKAQETPKEDLKEVSFEVAKGKQHTHAGKDYAEGDVITMRHGQAKRLEAGKVGSIVNVGAGKSE